MRFWLTKGYATPITAGSPTKNRCLYPFKPVGPYPLTPPVADSSEDRAIAEAGEDTRRRSDPRRIQWFGGNRVSNLIETDWITAGVQPVGGWRFFRPLLGVQPVGLSLHRRPQGIQMRERGPAGGIPEFGAG